MRVNRIKHVSAFAVIPNAIAQHKTLSLAARGLLVFLLSLPDGISINVRMIADMVPGLGKRGAAKALDEIEAAGYYVRITTRNSAGRLTTATAVYDTPQNGQAPNPGLPGTGLSGSNPVKNPLKETTPLPTLRDDPKDLADITALGDGEGGGEISTEDKQENPISDKQPETAADEPQGDDDTDPDDDGPRGGKPVDDGPSVEGVTSLLGRIRVASGDRLAVPVRDAGKVLPLVRSWFAVGASERQIVEAVTAGLPSEIRSATGFVVSRLRDRMPAPAAVAAPNAASAPMATCDGCERAHRGTGLCADCRTVETVTPKSIDDDRDPALSGAALARRLMAARLNKAA